MLNNITSSEPMRTSGASFSESMETSSASSSEPMRTSGAQPAVPETTPMEEKNTTQPAVPETTPMEEKNTTAQPAVPETTPMEVNYTASASEPIRTSGALSQESTTGFLPAERTTREQTTSKCVSHCLMFY
nr:PREDICTED: uncharacterized protein LOC107982617 isoform X1 [Anolis carolinensis]|eukprot:XP_016847712.1 PREDICTED: uncharacterized protein LOC107982617 isoform X1 [Anolis carolinensis]